MKTLFANAYASASLFYCNHMLFSFAQAISAYGDCRRDYELAMSAMEQTRGRTAQIENAAERAPQQPQPNQSKRRGSAGPATSATQPEEAKSVRMKEMAL